MQHIRVELDDEVFWWVYGEAAREQRKAHQQAALIIVRCYERRADKPDHPAGEPDETAA
jgi:hypothetical protein